MKNLVIPTRLTQGASKEQLLLEDELNKLIIKENRKNFIAYLFLISIVGLPIGIILLLVGRKNRKRMKELQNKINEIAINNAK